ncbi:MAG: hypothetical protein KDK60_04605, partial [Chlamydiia bacterium]|nr:hypothetical protein [Chlamydiia bacterium]
VLKLFGYRGGNVMKSKGIKLSSLKKKGDKYWHCGKWWKLNHPVKSTAKGKKMMVLATKTIEGERRVRLIHFGSLGYGHNYSKKAKISYLRRSAGIRNKKGELTKNDRWSPNYWSRKILWPSKKRASGPKMTQAAA